ncbi:MAG: slipin family protein [Cellvibrionaceae bacterium]|nr:slipin family protein [Cellvibrionaceae bacterium]
MLWDIIDIQDGARVILFINNQFKKVLTPGVYRVSKLHRRVILPLYKIHNPTFFTNEINNLLRHHPSALSQHVKAFALKDNEIGLLYENGELKHLVQPSKHFCVWKEYADYTLETITLSTNLPCKIDENLLTAMLAEGIRTTDGYKELPEIITYADIPDEHAGLLSVNGLFNDILPPGRHGYWTHYHAIDIQVIDLRLQPIELRRQEILTKDGVSLRISLSANYKIQNPKLAFLKISDIKAFIYRELQLCLREATTEKSLDALLENRLTLNSTIEQNVKVSLVNYGIDFNSCRIKDIALPNNIKLLLNQIAEAKKELKASLIKSTS